MSRCYDFIPSDDPFGSQQGRAKGGPMHTFHLEALDRAIGCNG